MSADHVLVVLLMRTYDERVVPEFVEVAGVAYNQVQADDLGAAAVEEGQKTSLNMIYSYEVERYTPGVLWG